MLAVVAAITLGCVFDASAFRTPGAAEEAYVEFDFIPVPCAEGPWKIKVVVESMRKGLMYAEEVTSPNGTPREVLCETYAAGLKEIGFEAKIIDKSKIRVYGVTQDGKFYPATKGSVETEGLKKNEVPKVTVVGKKG